MRRIAKLSPTAVAGRTPLTEMVDHLKRAWHGKNDRRPSRPLQHLDTWSDQAEVAFYEDCRAFRPL